MSAKTHGTVENTPYIDSFDLWGKEDLLWVYNITPTKWYRYDGFIDEIDLIDANNNVRMTIPIRTTKGIEAQSFFICPCCGKSIRYLYSIMPYVLKCRKCARLNYKSQQKNYMDTVAIFAAGMKYAEEALGWTVKDGCPADFPSYIPDRPKGMHKTTYARAMKKFRRYQELYEKKYNEELERVLKQAALEQHRRRWW